MFNAWLRSCLSCLWSQADLERENHGQAVQNKGVEREMLVCHSQPHLVPPMKLVFYDNMPSPSSPGPRSMSSLPPWMQETKSLASRASRRASILTRRTTHKRPTIGAPTDFRRAEPPRGRVASFRPLELSIYLPGNRLSDLPEFDGFDLNSPGQPSPPAKALISPFDSTGHLRRQSGPFQFARKPVGSAPSRRSSLATVELQLQQAQAQVRHSCDITASGNPLIPHFSLISPVGTSSLHSFSELRPKTERLERVPGSPADGSAPLPAALVDNEALRNHLFSLSSSSLWTSKSSPFIQERHSLDSYHPRSGYQITGKRRPGQSQSSSFTSSTAATSTSVSTTSPKKHHHSPTKSSSNFQHHSRNRTTSNSSVASKTPSLSSAITAATTIMPSDKELEISFTALPMVSVSNKMNTVVSSQQPQIHEDEKLHTGGYEYDRRFPGGSIGLAF